MKRIRSYFKSNRGFSLIEVLASVVIICIILIAFSQFFIYSNKTAVYNSEKLVLVNLANAELERLKLTGYNTTNPQVLETTSQYSVAPGEPPYKLTITKLECDHEDTDPTIGKEICEKKYNISNITVKVTSPKTNSKAAVEGYVPNIKGAGGP